MKINKERLLKTLNFNFEKFDGEDKVFYGFTDIIEINLLLELIKEILEENNEILEIKEDQLLKKIEKEYQSNLDQIQLWVIRINQLIFITFGKKDINELKKEYNEISNNYEKKYKEIGVIHNREFYNISELKDR